MTEEVTEIKLRPTHVDVGITQPSERYMSLRQNWIDATDEEKGVHGQLDVGAGLGSPMVDLFVEYRGQAVRGRFNISELFRTWLNDAVQQIDEALDPQRKWARMVRDSLVGTDGEVTNTGSLGGLPNMIDFKAWNGVCRDRIANRAKMQEIEIIWDRKMTGTVKFDG